MRKFIALALFIFCSLHSACSQVRWNLAANAGLSHMFQAPSNSHDRFAYRVGGGAIIPLKDWFSVRPSLYFSEKGVNFDGYYGSEQIDEAKYSLCLQYLELPVMAGFDIHLNNEASLVLKVGPFLSCGLNGRSKVSLANSDYEKTYGNLFDHGTAFDGCAYDGNSKVKNFGRFHRWDAGIQWGIACELSHISVGADISLSLTNATSAQINNDPVSGVVQALFTRSDKPKNLAAYFHIGYIF